MRRRLLVGWVVLGFVPGCTSLPLTPRPVGDAPGSWSSSVQRDHPLVSRIWDVLSQDFITKEGLAERLVAGRFILLGEKHNNADHHALQAWIVEHLTATGRRPAVAFEMLSPDDDVTIARYLESGGGSVAGLVEVAGWEHRGWPDWKLYSPLLETVLRQELPITSANLSAGEIRGMRKEGTAALPSDFVASFGLDRPLSPPLHEALVREIEEAHCGHASQSTVGTMIEIQRARDARMAAALLAADSGEGAVLVAGIGHVRRDRGVPSYLAAYAVSVGFVEVSRDREAPAAYAGEGAGATFDYVWFTPRVDELNPCERYKEQLKRLEKR